MIPMAQYLISVLTDTTDLATDPRREDGVAVKNEMSRCCVNAEGLPELLDHPSSRRCVGDAEVQDAAASVVDREPAVDEAKRHRRHDEEVHPGDGVAVVA
jgi:hypothetical protein